MRDGVSDTVMTSVALSRAELGAVMYLLKLPWVPGVGPMDVQKPPSDSLEDVLNGGIEALIARGFLHYTPSTTPSQLPDAQLLSPVVALVGACASSPYDLFLSLRRANKAQLAHLHQVGALGVIHTMPQPDIHFLESLPGRPGVLAAAEELLGLTNQASMPLPAGNIAAPYLRQAHRAVDFHVSAIASMLCEGGLTEPLANAMAAALTAARSAGVISIFRPSAGATAGALLLVIVATDVCFAMKPDADATHYHVQSVSADTLRAWLREQLPQEVSM